MSYDVLVLVGHFWKNDNIQEGI